MTDNELKLIKTKALLGGIEGHAYNEILKHAQMYGFTFEQLMKGADTFEHTGGHMNLTASADFDEEFWEHYEILTGRRPEPEDRGAFFRCAC